ncbi:MAG: P-II family nitrogen regulator [Chloroflexi bacterium]|nr:P-II family nitrogen regulator [Chloroflexota bacterium]MCH8900731.1 P-II family nitrogen regulator [Chloroflexota bacterium]
MKKIEAIIRPEKLPVVKAALEESGYPGMTITEVRGHGVQKGVTQQWRGREFVVEFLPKVKLEVVVTSDSDVDRILTLIHDNASTGNIGDGKVFVTDIADAMRVRTGERGEAVI